MHRSRETAFPDRIAGQQWPLTRNPELIMSASQIYSASWRVAVALLSLEIATVSALRYFIGSEPPPPPVAANAFANPFLILHVIGGVTALLLGPLQFVRRIRTRRPALHRATGRIYAGACALAAPAGFMLALGTTSGPVAGAGFAIPALLLPVFIFLGVRAAIERRFDAHREWMLRSYAIVSVAITLRLMLPASALLGFGFFPAYRVISWLSWTTNLALFEWHIRRTRAADAGYGRLVPA
jgi:uncharacterized membrane protein